MFAMMKRGPKGEKGDPGPRGPRGRRGHSARPLNGYEPRALIFYIAFVVTVMLLFYLQDWHLPL